jgi:hypothetical protein
MGLFQWGQTVLLGRWVPAILWICGFKSTVFLSTNPIRLKTIDVRSHITISGLQADIRFQSLAFLEDRR